MVLQNLHIIQPRRVKSNQRDGGYTGEAFAQWVKGLRPKLGVEVVKRSDTTKGFKVLARRWIVERTFGCGSAPVQRPVVR